MFKIKSILKRVFLICLIVLAAVGIGLAGGVPISDIKWRKDEEKDKIELIESNKDESDDVFKS